MDGMAGNEQVLALFLRALLAAKKSLNLYPAGSEMATTWIRRLHRALDGFVAQGLTFPIRAGADRFSWSGDDLFTIEPTLEALRFELETRGIASFSIEPAVEDWELQAFLELLNFPADQLESLAGAAEFLRSRSVVHVSVTAPSTVSQPSPDAALDPSQALLQSGRDPVDLFVEAVLQLVEERFGDLTYDRTGLTGWFAAVSEGDHVDQLYAAIKMLGGMADGTGDREVRMRTVLEALLELPEPTLRPLLTKWLVPLAGSDLVAFNVLSQLTEDELGRIVHLVPQDQLITLTTELIEFPWEEGKRQRLIEAITWTLRRRDEPPVEGVVPTTLSRDDPLLVELRQEIVAACQPDALLERSADVLLALVFHVEHDEYPGFAIDALEEIVAEALARTNVGLAVRVLSNLGSAVKGNADAALEHSRRLATSRSRLASRTHVSLVAGLLRQGTGPTQADLAAEYLRLVAPEGAQEFAELLADERDRRVRGRMCQVLARLGPDVLPVLLPRLQDKRWHLVRNILSVLGRMRHQSAFRPVAAALDHPHPRVRLEAVRALALIGGAQATGLLLRCATDPDRTVRRAAIKWLGDLGNEEAVSALRDIVIAPVEVPEDWEVKDEAARALVGIGTPFALGLLAQIAGRRVWFWKRTDKRIRALAGEALRARPTPDGNAAGDEE